MTSLFRCGAAILLAAVLSHPLLAQSPTLTINNPNYTATKLFNSTAGYTITGMAADSAGNVYYIESDNGFSADSILYRRSSIDGYATPIPVCNLGAGVFGSFVVYSTGKLYIGDNTTNEIRTVNADGTGGIDVLGLVPFNHDAVVVGSSLYLTNDPNGSGQGQVTKFNLIPQTGGDGGLMLDAGVVVINATGDAAGAIEFSQGQFFYGASGNFSAKGLYKFSATEINNAPANGALTLDTAHKFGATPPAGVGALAMGNSPDLWKDSDSSTSLLLFDRNNGGVDVAPPFGSVPNSVSLGQLDFAANKLFVNVTDYRTVWGSAIYTVAVPEPSSALLLLAGLTISIRRRR